MSNAHIDTGRLISGRGNINEGAISARMTSGRLDTDKGTFIAYITDKFGHYREEKDRSLKLEQEYIIAGKDSDYENMRAVAGRIFLLRFADNLAIALSDGGLRAEATAVALALEICLLDPTFTEPITNAILFACAYLETLSDVHVIYDGGRVPLHKSSHTMSVSDVLSGNRYVRPPGTGLTYGEYLVCFMAITGDERLNLRTMDLVELEIRRESANRAFMLDYGIERINAEIEGKGSGVGRLWLNRTYGYY